MVRGVRLVIDVNSIIVISRELGGAYHFPNIWDILAQYIASEHYTAQRIKLTL